MKLIFCHIENFGRLRDFDYRFSDGLNTVLRENGWGKSTFAAFLCAMLYGFPAARKKNPAENERLRFRPWQGGVYGGSLLFEAAGGTYEITRIFGARESEDVFELRDAATNLPSAAYSAKTGEELFHLDRDSFLRTVFTGQQDCAASATDRVSALIGAPEEQAGDMAQYSAAMKRLTDAAGRLSPRRPSGILARRTGEIARLERETSRLDGLPGQILEREEALRKAADEEAALREKILAIEGEIRRARTEEEGRKRDVQEAEAAAVDRSMRDHLRGQLKRRRSDVLSAAAAFPGRVPTRGEVDRYLDLCRQMDRLEEQIRSGQLSAREQTRLTALEDRFPEDGSSQGEMLFPEGGRPQEETLILKGGRPQEETLFPKGGRPQEETLFLKGGRPQEETLFPKGESPQGAGRAVCIAGMAAVLFLLAAGVVLCLTRAPRIGAGCIAAGVAMALAAAVAFFGSRGLSGGRAGDTSGQKPGAVKYAEAYEEAAEGEPGLEDGPFGRGRERPEKRVFSKEGELRREYACLREKEQRLERLHARWTELRREVEKFLRETERGDIPPDEDLYRRLTALRDAADDYEDALKRLREAQAQLHDLEAARSARDAAQGAGNAARSARNAAQGAGNAAWSARDAAQGAGNAARSARDAAQGAGNAARSAREMREARPTERERPPGEVPDPGCPPEGVPKAAGEERGGMAPDPLHRILALQEKKEELQAALSERRKAAEEGRRLLEELQAQREEQMENLRCLQELRIRQEADTVRYRQITAAARALQGAKESLSARYADPIRERFSHYWERITRASAAGVYVDADSNVTVEEAGKQREMAFFSEGYRDLAGICLRAALADAMYPEGRSERPPLILDDPFVNLDDERTEGALRFLGELSERYQILYFTCSLSRTL